MSREVPTEIGELSQYALEQAIDKIDHALADAPEDQRAAVAVIRLVTGGPAPWYGAVIDPGDSSVTVGVVMRNAFEAVGDWIDTPTDRGLETKADHWFTRQYLPLWRMGKRAYNDYLDRLGTPRVGK